MIGRSKGGMNSKLHMVSDRQGRPLTFFLPPGQITDDQAALALLARLPTAKRILGDRGCDAGWLREELKSRDLRFGIPARRGRRRPARRNRRLNRKRQRVENAIARLEGWRRITIRCADLFLSAIRLVATVLPYYESEC